MFLKSIELKGFKSFADRTHIDFLPGVTCIVGPNGCGKSNIIDAIRWVLGEQSSISLRARRMEDVIFSGTKHRPAQNFASVKLVFSQAQEISPGGGEELSVERILHRSGESTYKINSQAVRLRDLRQLFMDTAIGVSGYSLISQGDIDDILKENKQDRRKIFEEASGISLIHYKKLEASRRLARVEDHYLRMMDILVEVEERREPLGEESNRAQEYLQLAEKARELDLYYSKEDFISYEKEEEVLAREASRLAFDLEEVISKRESLNEKREENRQRSELLEKEFSLLQDLIREKTGARDDYYLELRLKEERLRQLEREKEGLARDTQLEDQENPQKRIDEAADKKKKTEARLDQLAQEIDQLSSLIDLSSRDLEGLSEKKDLLSQSLSQLRLELDQLAIRDGELSRLKETTADNKNELEEELREYKDQIKELEGKKSQLERGAIRLRRTRDELEASSLEEEDKKSFLAAKKAELDSRLSSLDKSIDIYKKWEAEGSKELEKYKKLLGGEILYQKLRPKKGFEKALEAALGPAINSLDIRGASADWQQAAVSLLYKEPQVDKTLEDPASLGRLEDFVEGPAGLLSNYLVYSDLETALKGPSSAIRLTLDGQRLESGFYHPLDQAPSPFEISLKLEENLQEKDQILKELDQLDKDVNLNQEKLLSLKTQEEAFFEEEEKFLSKEKDLGDRLLGLESKEEIALFKYQQFDKNLESFTHQLEELYKTSIKLKEKLSTLEIEESNLMILLDDDKKEDLETHREKLLNLRLEEAGAKEEVKSWQALIESLELQDQESRKREELRKNRQKEQDEEALELKDGLDLVREDYAKVQLEIKKLDQQAFELKKEIDQLRGGYSQAEKDREELDERLFKLQEDKNKKEIALSRLEERKTSLSQEIWDKYELSMLQVKELELSCEEPRSHRNKIRRQMRKLEPVNLKAPEEFKEIDQRYSFLKEQLEDIEASKADLNRTISSLEKKMIEEFTTTFDAIRENFQEIFTHLFRGGQGDILLEDPEDVLTSDILILASPPGKKLQHMNLLSGGEKALTAIALLFAVLKTKPAPFYVLDEVEAALDDINIQRFGSFLEEFSLGSQFILITHRKGTMEFADALYGVSMEEKGISSLISLKMEE